MKAITERLNESIMINEAGKIKNVIVAFDHDNPEETYIFFNIDPKEIPDWLYYEELKNPTAIVGFSHSDEDPAIWNIAQSESSMKAGCMKEIKDHIKNVKKGDRIDGLYPTMGGWFEWMDEEYFDEDPNFIYKGILDSIEQSYIDCDSASVYAVINIVKKEIVLSGDTNIWFVDDLEDWKKAHGFDEE